MNIRPTICLAIKVLQINISSIFYFILSSYVPHLQEICNSKYFHTKYKDFSHKRFKKNCFKCGSYMYNRLFQFSISQLYGSSTEDRFPLKIVHLFHKTSELLIYLITPVTASKIAQVDCCGRENHDKWFRMIFHYMSRRAPCFYAVVKTETADWNGWLWLEGEQTFSI